MELVNIGVKMTKLELNFYDNIIDVVEKIDKALNKYGIKLEFESGVHDGFEILHIIENGDIVCMFERFCIWLNCDVNKLHGTKCNYFETVNIDGDLNQYCGNCKYLGKE